MMAGYREQTCPRCGTRFPVLARAGAPIWCSYAHAEAALRPLVGRRSA